MENRIGNKSETNVDLYIIPRGRVIYQKTAHDNLWPGAVQEPFTANKGAYSKRYRMTEFISTTPTTLYFNGKTRTFFPGKSFYAYTKGLKMVK